MFEAEMIPVKAETDQPEVDKVVDQPAEKTQMPAPRREHESSGVRYRSPNLLDDKIYTLTELTLAMDGDVRGWKFPDETFVSQEEMRKLAVSSENVNRATKRDE